MANNLKQKHTINFDLFCLIIKTEVLNFSEEWDNDEWNDAYVNFRHYLEYLMPEFKSKFSERYLAIDWAEGFYCDNTPDTHTFWLKQKK